MTTDSTAFLNEQVEVVIDRPLGSTHPKHSHITYEVNYGHVPATISGDGEELDAYVLNVTTSLESFTGCCIAIIRRQKEDDDKLIVVTNGDNVTDAEIRRQTRFQEKFFESEIIRGPEE